MATLIATHPTYTNSRKKKHQIYPIKPKCSFQGSQPFCYSYHIIIFLSPTAAKKRWIIVENHTCCCTLKIPIFSLIMLSGFVLLTVVRLVVSKKNTATVKCFLGWRSAWLNSLHIPVDNQAAMTSLQRSEGNWFCGKRTVVDWLM